MSRNSSNYKDDKEKDLWISINDELNDDTSKH